MNWKCASAASLLQRGGLCASFAFTSDEFGRMDPWMGCKVSEPVSLSWFHISFMFHDGPLTWQILTAFLIMSGYCLHFVIRCLLSFPLKSWAPRSHAWPSFPGRVCTLRTVRAYHECFLQLLPRSSCQSATRRKGIELWCKTVIGTWIRRIALWAGTWHMAMSVTGCYSKSWQIPRIGKVESNLKMTPPGPILAFLSWVRYQTPQPHALPFWFFLYETTRTTECEHALRPTCLRPKPANQAIYGLNEDLAELGPSGLNILNPNCISLQRKCWFTWHLKDPPATGVVANSLLLPCEATISSWKKMKKPLIPRKSAVRSLDQL